MVLMEKPTDGMEMLYTDLMAVVINTLVTIHSAHLGTCVRHLGQQLYVIKTSIILLDLSGLFDKKH